MLIFLAALAFLLMLFALGERAAPHVWHGGRHRYLDRCEECGVDYPRPAAIQRLICPRGHVMSAVVAEPHTPQRGGLGFVALCAGFIVVALILTGTGVVPP
ncbi:MAG: hypothetical protein ABI352_04425 [Candidatus Dormibacter sp.]